jgi:hypothetical protein
MTMAQFDEQVTDLVAGSDSIFRAVLVQQRWRHIAFDCQEDSRRFMVSAPVLKSPTKTDLATLSIYQ